jgi:hypothetical protein
LILITGEGAHQMTAQEISQFGRRGLRPIVFVLNNSGYLSERMLCKDMALAYNDIAPVGLPLPRQREDPTTRADTDLDKRGCVVIRIHPHWSREHVSGGEPHAGDQSPAGQWRAGLGAPPAVPADVNPGSSTDRSNLIHLMNHRRDIYMLTAATRKLLGECIVRGGFMAALSFAWAVFSSAGRASGSIPGSRSEASISDGLRAKLLRTDAPDECRHPSWYDSRAMRKK